MVDQGASDLHLSAGAPPEFRINGRMVRVKMEPLTPEDLKEICYGILVDDQKASFEAENELDFSFGIPGLSRFRGNLFVSKGSVAAVFRVIPSRIPGFEELGLPLVLKKVMKRPHGLILVTGPTGSGKSTTLAAMLDYINQEEFGHIITIEDPIEFVHGHKNCVVNQREVGSDTGGFLDALRRILRQDPDYILVGELRDRETMEMALTMAETGHLVFGTLHTNGAIQSVNRIINSFEPHKQVQVRQALSQVLQAVYSQQLVAKRNGPGRALVAELMIPNI
ncbi:PilT/PilU family type 4a pilus ATPase, partial [bacterium]|nr:PilT/PilU family type 4a pilus ATPase [bacterium]